MKYLLGLILSLIGGNVAADAIPFPPCDINNQPVTYISIGSTYNNAYAKVYIAESAIVNGKHLIAYNSKMLSSKPREWILQVMLHECGHIKLHIGKTTRSEFNDLKEFQADCHSATVLKKEYGYKNKEFDIILDTMKEILPHNRIYAFKSCINR